MRHEDDEDNRSSLLGRVVAFCLLYPELIAFVVLLILAVAGLALIE
ncbi:hypothetical protein [Pseudarthrobacter sp. NPDC058119]